MNQSQPEPKLLPADINTYIKNAFVDDYLTEIRPYTDHHGNLSWFVDVTHNGSVYHLRFNAAGLLIDKDIETISFPGEDAEMGEGD